MTQTNAYIINHTHWDREWFLTSVYTTPWIADLIDHLQVLVDRNPSFQFYFDGQTLVIEDLLKLDPDYRVKVERLIRGGNLSIGPYYCQPDWRLTSSEALIRNLLFGRRDMEQYGLQTEIGWLVDTFGHISQAPQLHRMFSLECVYVWRGIPQLEPYFTWQGADGSELLAVHLFAGYRNLYGVTHAPEIAVKRLRAEVEKLDPLYPTSDIPLFDGYDLEDNPEDPLRFFHGMQKDIPEEIRLIGATPESFARHVQTNISGFSLIQGELLSGKYASVFPGTLSTRDYLKVMARDCDHLLYRVCEPLGTMAGTMGRSFQEEKYEAWSRGLLQNAVHDCICGVSIDQVHEKMEFSYRQIFEGMQEDIRASLAYILQDFAPGDYAISTNSFPVENWHVLREQLCHIQTNGVGVWEIEKGLPIQRLAQPVEEFEWVNRHYEARVRRDGTVQVGNAILGSFLVHEEAGDTYSDEIGQFLGPLQPAGLLVIEQKSDLHCILGLDLSASWGDRHIFARLHLVFDPSPLVRWQIDFDTRGSGFRVEVIFETGIPGQVFAGMPFDLVRRPDIDKDTLPRQLDENLSAVLLGQRDLGSNRIFPFHDMIASTDPSNSALVLAKGLHAYQADETGRISVTLRRAVEWLAKPDLLSRVGDAGPFFYVPGARCERSITHELAFGIVNGGGEDPQIQALNAGFQNPPLIVESQSHGTRKSWQFFQESLPMSSMHIEDGHIMARLYNPFTRSHLLGNSYSSTGISTGARETIEHIPAKKIANLDLGEPNADKTEQTETAKVNLVNPPAWRVGPDQGCPDPRIIQQLKEKMVELERQIEGLNLMLPETGNDERYRWQHRIFVLQRELLEYRLSVRLNEIKLAKQGELSYEDLYKPDQEIAELGRQLNRMRIQRRIYDYIIQTSYGESGSAHLIHHNI